MISRLTSKKMTSRPIRINICRLSALLAALLLYQGPTRADEKPTPPTDGELDELLGEKLSRPVTSLTWRAGEPPKNNLFIYAAKAQAYRPELLKSLASALGVHGDLQALPAIIFYAPGYWIKEPNPTNKETWKALIYSKTSGMIRYSSGEDNHKWDLKNHRPLAAGVPSEQEALQRTLSLLPALGITTNDLEHLQSGELRYACNDEGTQFNDRYDNGKHKRYIRQINIELWQGIQDGASVLSIGGGGMLRVGYISEGRLAELEMTFRSLIPAGQVSPKTSKELIGMLKHGVGRTFQESVPTAITITNCALVYPEANSAIRQDYLWPAYALEGMAIEGGETNIVRIYQPLLK
jgi:hypothetical protein